MRKEKAIISTGFVVGIFIAIVALSGVFGTQSVGVEPTSGKATVRLISGSVYGADNSDNSHIENIYIVDNSHAAGYAINFSGNENVLDTIEASAGTASIDYDTRFIIIVAVKGHSDNLAYVTEENIKIEMDSSDLGISPAENSADADEYPFENNGYGTSTGYVRLNAIWDNSDAGYILSANESASLTSVKLWTWS